MNLLQARIEELNSAILHLQGNRVYIEGFHNSDRLKDYLNGKDCWQSKGLYDFGDLDYSRIKDNCLLIVTKEGSEITRYYYQPVFKGIVKYKNIEKKTVSRMFTLRKCLFSNYYNIHILDENNIKQSIIYDNTHELKLNFETIYPDYKLYSLDNKRIKGGLESLWDQDSLFEL